MISAHLAAKLAGALALAALVVWTSLNPSPLTVWVLASPLLLLAFMQARQWRAARAQGQRGWPAVLGAALALAAFAAAVAASDFLMARFGWLYLAQHVGVHAALAVVFGRTLLARRTPLCTQLAAWVHDDVTEPPLARYTRAVTAAWTLYFTAVCAVSLALFFGASFTAWTWFSTAGTLIGTGAMFVLENFARRFFLPAKDRIGLLRTIEVVSRQFSRS
jgi:uncharacterized membrane protein